MDQAIRQKIPGKPRVLVAPLDWGLGHSTRCIPIIRQLLAASCEVIIAGNKQQAALLSAEFPALPILPLQGYDVRYGTTGSSLVKAILSQVPKLLKNIRTEQQWLQSAYNKFSFDAVISDNRFGLYHDRIPSVFITHQLAIKSGLGRAIDQLLRKKNYNLINRFSECWVPDHEPGEGLGGSLSHPSTLPRIPVKYTGPLTRMNITGNSAVKDHLLVLLSGPEPQRSIFEKKLLDDLQPYNGTVSFVRGLPGSLQTIPSPGHITIHNHLPAVELENEMAKAAFIISRCGYTSVMDITSLMKKSILIPTPGQGEQEYLAEYLAKKGMIVTMKQKEFSLEKALAIANAHQYAFPGPANNIALKKVIADFIRTLNR